MRIARIALTSLVTLLGMAFAAHAETRLIMFDSPGCFYCAKWRAEIGPIYPKTAEGKAAPITEIHIGTALPEDIHLARRPVYTPTFVLLRDGIEVTRIEGYPGEDFFWGLLEKMLSELPPEKTRT